MAAYRRGHGIDLEVNGEKWVVSGEIDDPLANTGKTVAHLHSECVVPDTPHASVTLAVFTDGTGIAPVTSHHGPYSEMTPDLDFYVEWRVARKAV